jgi:hypothetical protein
MKKLLKSFTLGYFGSGDDLCVDAINFSVSEGPKEEGFLYEFSVALVSFRDGRYAMQARVFSDAWASYRDCPEVWALLAQMHRCFESEDGRCGPEPFDEIVAKLEKAGWKNDGRHQPRYYRTCGECGHEWTSQPPSPRSSGR